MEIELRLKFGLQLKYYCKWNNPFLIVTLRVKKTDNIQEWTQFGIVAKEKPSGRIFHTIDFADFQTTNNKSDFIIINLNLKRKIKHTIPPLDRCCKHKRKTLRYDHIDNIARISCDIPKADFKEQYIDKRFPVLLIGCQDDWKARNWTFHNLLTRYSSKWPVTWYHGKKEDCYAGYLHGPTAIHMMRNKVNLKSITHLPRSWNGKLESQR